MSAKEWRTVPLWSLVSEQRQIVEPDGLGDEVVHYSIPSFDSHGTGSIEETSSIRSAKLKLHGGEVLISKLNPRKSRVLIARESDLPIVSSTEFVGFRLSAGLDPRFLMYLLRSESTRQHLDSQVQSVTRSHQRISPEDVTHLSVRLPPLEEQRRIADFLDAETARIDKLATATQQQAAVLGERLQETFREATTTDGGSGVATGIDWMPLINQDWGLNKVAHHFRLGGGTTPSSGESKYFGEGVRWANSGDVTNGIIESVGKSVTLDAIHDYPSLEVYPRGTLVVALYGQGETKGRVGILGVEACLNQACCALVESGGVLADYAFFWLRAHKAGIISLAVGAGQPNLSQDLIKSLRIPAPDRDGQQRILQRLKLEEGHVAGLIGRLESRTELLSERRQALITAAVTGQIDVSTASGRGIEE